MDMSQGFDFHIAVVLIVAFLVGGACLRRDSKQKWANDAAWTQIEMVGVKPGTLSWPRALIHSLTSTRDNAHKGYFEHCKKHDRPFAIPSMWTGRPIVILPPSQLHLLSRPESELTGFWALMENIQLSAFIPDRDVIENVIHFEVTRKDMNHRNVDRQAAASCEEIDASFRDLWGTNEEQWRTVNGWDMCGQIIARVALRTIVGDVFCRDAALLGNTRLFANSLFAAAAFINCMPRFLRPVLAPPMALQAKYYATRCRKRLLPLIQDRIRLWEARQATGQADGDLPNDFLQWLIPRCADHGATNLSPSKIASRLLAINTMFVFAMSYVFAHVVLDICVSPDKDATWKSLRQEAQRVSGRSPGSLAGRVDVDQLFRTDSVIRESMRLSDFGVFTLPRDVTAAHALDLGNGISIPPGTRVAFASQAMHVDPDYHQNPLHFDAFRFSRGFEDDLGESVSHTSNSRRLMVTSDPGFLAFGYGKRACPGRWFVAQTLKQALSYLVLHYDVELVGPAPRRKALLNMMVPPTEAKLRFIRRRASLAGL